MLQIYGWDLMDFHEVEGALLNKDAHRMYFNGKREGKI